MIRPIASLLVLAGLAGAGYAIAAAGAAEAPRDAIARYGIGGFMQPIGLHHGFHIQKVELDSPAERDRLVVHDIIVKVDGEEVRSLEHLRTLLTDIDEDDGEGELTIMREGALEHHIVKCHLKTPKADPAARKTAPKEDDRP